MIRGIGYRVSLPRLAPALFLLALLLGCGRDEAPSVEVDRHSAEIVVQPDGSLVVAEEFAGRLVGGARAFDRRVESDRSDGLTIVSASLDGHELTAGEPGPAQLDVLDEGEALHVRWELTSPAGTAGPGAVRTFGLRYRVEAATEALPQRGRVLWTVLPAGRAYAVGASEVVLTLPESSEWLRGTGIAEAGWTVEATEHGVIARRSDVGLDPVTLQAEFTIDRRVITLPYWQVTADLRSEFSLAFVAGGLFVLVIGAGVLWLIGFQYRTPKPQSAGPQVRGPAVGVALSPAAAAALADPRRAGPEAMRELIARGLVDPERLVVAQGLRTTAWVGALIGVSCAIVAQLALGRFGWWAQTIPLSLLLVAAVFVVAGRRFRVLTESGRRASGSRL
jgi:hypothetical protein